MKQEFETLIAHDWDADYINYLTVANFNNQALKAHAIALATAQTQAQKKVIWNIIKAIPGFGLAIGQDAVGNPIPQPDVVHLANPYYVGFGEPDADILFVGKEKGFDLISVPLQNGRNSIDKLFHESILDYFHWAKMVAFAQTGGVINDAYINNFADTGNFDFCPMFQLAQNYYNAKYNESVVFETAGFTWKLYQKLVNKIINTAYAYDRGSTVCSNTFFSKCFMTELNYIPVEGGADFNWGAFNGFRRGFLSHDFYKTFPIVIVNAKGHLRAQESEVINGVFDVDILVEADLTRAVNLTANPANYGIYFNRATEQHEIALNPGRRFKFPVSVYRSKDKKRHVFCVWQLSSAGQKWANASLERLADLVSLGVNL